MHPPQTKVLSRMQMAMTAIRAQPWAGAPRRTHSDPEFLILILILILTPTLTLILILTLTLVTECAPNPPLPG